MVRSTACEDPVIGEKIITVTAIAVIAFILILFSISPSRFIFWNKKKRMYYSTNSKHSAMEIQWNLRKASEYTHPGP